VIIAGQAKSHCVAWTIDDLLTEIQSQDPSLAQKVYLLEDCSSPVVVPAWWTSPMPPMPPFNALPMPECRSFARPMT
jgi:nicotinamidase-related amidase